MIPKNIYPLNDIEVCKCLVRLPAEPGGSVPVLPHELEAVLYRAEAAEWPPRGDRAAACRAIAQHIGQVSTRLTNLHLSSSTLLKMLIEIFTGTISKNKECFGRRLPGRV